MRTPNVLIPYSIVIPARNEEETIEEVLQGVRDMTDDLIVVDGHSTDRTVDIAKDYGARVVQDNGRGKGDAVRVGLATARHPITVLIDADGSHDPKDIPKLVAPIIGGDADLVMGSRMLGGSEDYKEFEKFHWNESGHQKISGLLADIYDTYISGKVFSISKYKCDTPSRKVTKL